MEILCAGYGLVESPRWHGGRLWFSDWTGGRIVAVDDAGASEVVVEHRSLPMCFDFLPDGRLVLVSNQHRELLTLEGDGLLAHYADLSSVSAYGCNDIVVDGRGNAYVNSPAFDFATGYAAHLFQLQHEIRLGMQPAGGVNDQHVSIAGLRRLYRVEQNG